MLGQLLVHMWAPCRTTRATIGVSEPGCIRGGAHRSASSARTAARRGGWRHRGGRAAEAGRAQGARASGQIVRYCARLGRGPGTLAPPPALTPNARACRQEAYAGGTAYHRTRSGTRRARALSRRMAIHARVHRRAPERITSRRVLGACARARAAVEVAGSCWVTPGADALPPVRVWTPCTHRAHAAGGDGVRTGSFDDDDDGEV